MQMHLSWTNLDAERLRDEASKAYPRECCGLLIGQGDTQVTVTGVVATKNLSEDPARFLIDPQSQFDWMRKLRDTGQRIVGHYHSHPNGVGQPSSHDEAMAQDTEQIWVIVPVHVGRAGEPKGYRLKAVGQGFVSVPITEIDSAS